MRLRGIAVVAVSLTLMGAAGCGPKKVEFKRPPNDIIAESSLAPIRAYDFIDAFKTQGDYSVLPGEHSNETSWATNYIANWCVDMLLAEGARNLYELDKTREARQAFQNHLDRAVVDAVLQRDVAARVDITEKELQEEYKTRRWEFERPDSYVIRQIFAEGRRTDREARDKAREKIQGAQDALNRGESFVRVARIYSDARMEIRGVELGPYSPGEIPTVEVDEAMQQLAAGENSGVIETDKGFFIIRVERITPGNKLALNEVRPKVRNYVYQRKEPQEKTRYFQNLRKRYAGQTEINAHLLDSGDVASPSDTIVRVDRHILTLGEYQQIRQIRNIHTRDRDMAELQKTADLYMALLEGYKARLNEDPAVKRSATVRHVRWLAGKHLETALAEESEPRESEIRQEFEARTSLYGIPTLAQGHCILIRAQTTPDMFRFQLEKAWQEAELQTLAILERLREGHPFGELAAAYSQHPSASLNGYLGWITPGDDAVLDHAYFTIHQLKPGEITRQPIRGSDGYYLFYCSDVREGRERTFEEARPLVRNALFDQKMSLGKQGMRQETRQKLNITYHSDKLDLVCRYIRDSAVDLQRRALY